ncbi:MAG: hypothetical protein AB1758_14370 [Candidatus Eremiobacterota bacterium]
MSLSESGQEAAQQEAAQQAQEQAVQQAIESGQPVQFTNSAGETVTVTVTVNTPPGSIHGAPGSGAENYATYSYSIDGGDPVEVVTDVPVADHNEALASVIDMHSQQPEHLQGTVTQVNVWNRPSDRDEWAHSTPNGDGTSTLDFFEGTSHLHDQGLFDHEFGHAVGHYVDTLQETPYEAWREQETGHEQSDMRPHGWEGDIREDGQGIVHYLGAGSDAVAEDFADSYMEYMQARRDGTLDQYRDTYPNRGETLDGILSGSLPA